MISFDLETERFEPLYQAPRPVLAQVAGNIASISCEGAYVQSGALMARPGSIAYQSILDHVFESGFIGQNAPFDLAVCMEHENRIEQAFALLDQGLVHSVDIRQKLLDIARGDYTKDKRYNLGALAIRYGTHADKTSPWRTRYAELEHTPFDTWPREAIEYAINDVRVLPVIFDEQEKARALFLQDFEHDPLADEARCTRGAFALALVSYHGIVPDREALDYYRAWIHARIRTARKMLLRAGLLKLTHGQYAKREKFMQERVRRAWGGLAYTGLRDWLTANRETVDDFQARTKLDGIALEQILEYTAVQGLDAFKAQIVREATRGEYVPYPRTPSGKYPQLDAATAEVLDMPELRAWLDYGSAINASTRYSEVARTLCNLCRKAKKKSGNTIGICGACGSKVLAIHTRFDLAETGRSKSSGPNIQNRNRKGPDRETFAPTEGIYLITDHEGLELTTLAQVCVTLGCGNKLAQALNSGLNGHLMVAARLLETSYEDVAARRDDPEVKRAYQMAKPINFGFPGGMGTATFCAWALQSYGQRFTIKEARKYKALLLETWPEYRKYFRLIGNLTRKGHATIVQLFSNRVRGGCKYTDACNTFFQGLGADVTHDVLFELQRACYTKPRKNIVWDVIDLVREGEVDVWKIAEKTGHEIQQITRALLYGARVENYVHDEYLLACGYRPVSHGDLVYDPTLTARARAKEAIVCGVAQRWLPDMHPTAVAVAARRWSKSAREIRDEQGRLIVWETCDEIDDVVQALGASERARTDYGRAIAKHASAYSPGLDARLSSAVLGYRRPPPLEHALAIIDRFSR